MKPVMYHYVRPSPAELSKYPYLALADFERQLDHIEAAFGFVERSAFESWVGGGPVPEGVLLTFDDGLRDHVEHVLPMLRARGLFGLFYVASGPFETNELLDVHKLHLALGRLGGPAALSWLAARHPDLLERSGSGTVDPYTAQSSDAATKRVKRLFNWQLDSDARQPALDALLSHAFDAAPPHWREFYLDESGVRQLVEAGMGVGGHGHTHAILGHLEPEAERMEIESSKAFTRALVGTLDWGFCYPHGIVGASGEGRESLVAGAGWPFAFAVAASDVDTPLAHSRRFALPRHNCNAFAHGSASSATSDEVLQ